MSHRYSSIACGGMSLLNTRGSQSVATLHAFCVWQSPQDACLFVCLLQISTAVCSHHIFPFVLYFRPLHTLTDWPDFSIHSSSSKQHLSSRCRKLGLSGPTEFGSPPEDFMLCESVSADSLQKDTEPRLRDWTHHPGHVWTDAAFQPRQLCSFPIVKCYLHKTLWWFVGVISTDGKKSQ